MTVFEKVWEVQTINQNVDNVDTNGTRSEFLFQLYTLLTNPTGLGAWSVEKACNGVAAADSDLYAWTSATDVVFGTTGVPINTGDMNNGTAHSWIELKSPDAFPTVEAGNTYLVIDCGGIASSDGLAQIHVGTVTATAATGTTLRRPTLTVANYFSFQDYTSNQNGIYNYRSPYQTSTSYNALMGIPFTWDYDALHVNYFQGGRTSEGAFWFMNTQEGSGYPVAGGMIMNLVDSPRTSAVDPWTMLCSFGRSQWDKGFFSRVGAGYASTLLGNDWTSDYQAQYGTIQTQMFDQLGQARQVANSGWTYVNLGGIVSHANTVASQQGSAGSGIDSKMCALPIWAFSLAGGLGSVRGRIPDIKAAPTNTPIQGTIEPSVGTAESAILGGLWWPVDDTPIVI